MSQTPETSGNTPNDSFRTVDGVLDWFLLVTATLWSGALGACVAVQLARKQQEVTLAVLDPGTVPHQVAADGADWMGSVGTLLVVAVVVLPLVAALLFWMKHRNRAMALQDAREEQA